MSIIKPTVGRVVWFYPDQRCAESDFEYMGASPAGLGEPLAAIIVHVHNDRLVNLTVFDSIGRPHGRRSVQLAQEGDGVPEHGGYAAWMPYQLGQAARTEKAEATLAQNAGSPQPQHGD